MKSTVKDLYQKIQELPEAYRPDTLRELIRKNPRWLDLHCTKIKVVTKLGSTIEQWWSIGEARKNARRKGKV